jgi:hypothetical protein
VRRPGEAATALCSEFRVYAAGRLKAELQTFVINRQLKSAMD